MTERRVTDRMASVLLACLLCSAPMALAQQPGDAVASHTFGDLYSYGGWVNHVIVGVSVIALALIMERLIALRTGAILPRRFVRQFSDHWRRRDIRQVVATCTGSDSSIARILFAALAHYEQSPARMEEAVGEARESESAVLRHNLSLIQSLGNLATLLGLFGTIIGMIQAFDTIARSGTGDARLVAGGIFQALITTAAGLMVAIPALFAYSFLRRRVERFEIELDKTSARLLAELQRTDFEGHTDLRPVAVPEAAALASAGS